ncbi:MAG: ABC transporter permease [Chloroflexi bacterium]|nr:ABC transporter permease [Chloroflexota bacterium]
MYDSTPAFALAERVGPLPRATPVASGDLGVRRRRSWAWARTPSAVVGIALTAVVLALAALADVLAPGDPFAPVGPALSAPSSVHLIGTDDLGRDLLSGVIHGIRTSVFVALGVGLIAFPLGVVVGAVAGARGGVVDDVLMRLSEVWQVLPRFFLALMVVALFGPGLDRIVLVLGLTSWALLARIMRAEILSIREREFVDAARALGMSEARILRRHMLPHVMPAAIVFVALLLAQVCLVESSLGFLGLSDPNAISLGYLAAQAQRFLRVAWWMWFFPGVALITIVIGFNLVGDAINDRMRGRL